MLSTRWPRRRVLVVEDDPGMQRFYGLFFERVHAEEFAWRLACDAEQALDALREQPLDVVVLDWVLPGGLSGLSILKALRSDSRTRGLGVLFVTGRSATHDAVTVLDSGADDYIAKPFDESLLLARLRSLVRRRLLTLASHRVYEAPGLSWDLDADLLRVGGRRVDLTPKESALLKIFLERPEVVHPMRSLWEAVWGDGPLEDEHVVVAAVSALRRKLGSLGRALEGRRGRGYVFSKKAL